MNHTKETIYYYSHTTWTYHIE